MATFQTREQLIKQMAQTKTTPNKSTADKKAQTYLETVAKTPTTSSNAQKEKLRKQAEALQLAQRKVPGVVTTTQELPKSLSEMGSEAFNNVMYLAGKTGTGALGYVEGQAKALASAQRNEKLPLVGKFAENIPVIGMPIKAANTIATKFTDTLGNIQQGVTGQNSFQQARDIQVKAIDDFIMKNRSGELSKAVEQQFGGKTTQGIQKIGELAEGAGGLLATIATGGKPGMFASVYGNSYSKARQEGATDTQAKLYATTNASFQTALEKLSGGIPGLDKGAATDALKKVFKNKAITGLVDTLGEGLEEAISTAIDPIIQRFTYNPQAELATLNEIGSDGLAGIILSGIFQGAGKVANITTPKTQDTQIDNINTIPTEQNENLSQLQANTEQNVSKDVETVQKLLEKAKIDGNIVKSIVTPSGKQADGLYVNGKILINENSQAPIIFVAKHEITHGLKKQVPVEYGKYEKYVIDTLIEDGEYQNKIEEYKNLYETNGIKLSDEQLNEEIVADFTEKILTDQYAIDRLVNNNITIGKKILNFISDLVKKFSGDKKLLKAEKYWTEAIKKATGETSKGSAFKITKDSNNIKLTPEQQKFFKDSKVVDEKGNLKPMYHGTQRADRVGNYFDPTKATSGPMAYFTDNKGIAENYSTEKRDTSISREIESEYDQFKIEGMSLKEYWNTLNQSEKNEISKRAKNVGFDEDGEEIVYNENDDSFGGQYDYYLRKDNPLDALYKVFIEDGNLFGEEKRFLEVLNLAGVKNVDFFDTEATSPGVYETYLNIKNPFDALNISDEMLNKIEKASKKAQKSFDLKESYAADMWDKTSRPPKEWFDRLKEDVSNGTSNVWTSIPDWVTNVLKENGYDGVKDLGGKQGGLGHEVVIPFYSNQIKNVDNTNPTESEDIRYKVKKELPTSVVEAYNEVNAPKTVDNIQINKTLNNFKKYIINKLGIKTEQNKTELNNIISSYSQHKDYEKMLMDISELSKKIEIPYTESDPEAKKIISDFKLTKIGVSDIVKNDIPDYNEFRKSMFGKLRLSNKGLPIDTYYAELNELRPDLFPSDITNETDQLNKIAEVAKIIGSKTLAKDIYGESFSENALIEANNFLIENKEFQNLYNQFEKEKINETRTNNSDRISKKSTETKIEPTLDTTMQKVNETLEKTPEQIKQDKVLPEVTAQSKKEIKEIKDNAVKNVVEVLKKEGKSRAIKKAVDVSQNVSEFKQTLVDSKIITPEAKDVIEKADLKYDVITNKDTLKKARKSLDANPNIEAMKFITLDPKMATAEDIAKGRLLVDAFQKAGDYETEVAVIRKVQEMLTNAGQTVQAAVMFQKMTPQGMKAYIIKELDNVGKAYKEKKGKTAFDKIKDQFELSEEEATKVVRYMEAANRYKQDVEDLAEKRTTTYDKVLEDKIYRKQRQQVVEVAKAQKIFNDKLPTDVADQVKTIRRISLLFNLKTQIRNVVSNISIMPINAISDVIGTPIDYLLSKTTGKRTTALPQGGAMLTGFGRGIKESWQDSRLGIDTRSTNLKKYEIGRGNTWSNKNIISRFMNRTEKFLNAVMDIGDRPFAMAEFNNSLKQQMIKNKVAQPTPEMIQIANEQALQRTWQDDNNWTKSSLAARKLLNFGMPIGLGDAAMPFAKTPANLTKAIIDYSPAGLVKVLTNDIKQYNVAVENGQDVETKQKQLVNDLSKAITGTMVYSAVYMLVKQGLIQGERDEDKDTRNFMKDVLGLQPYSIKIGDKTYTYSWNEPLGTTVSIMDSIIKGEGTLPDIFNTIADNILEQSYMHSVQQLFDNNYDISDRISNFVSGIPAQFVPTLLGQLANYTDPYARVGYDRSSLKANAIAQIKAKTPGLKSTLPKKYNTLGEPIKAEGSNLERAFNSFLNPALTRNVKSTDLTKEMVDLYKQTGSKTMFPTTAPNSLTFKNQTYKLTPAETQQWQKDSGEYTKRELEKVIKTDKYKSLSNDDKAKVMSEVISNAKTYARDKYLSSKGTETQETAPKTEEKSELDTFNSLNNTNIKEPKYNAYKKTAISQEELSKLYSTKVEGAEKDDVIDSLRQMKDIDTMKKRIFLSMEYTMPKADRRVVKDYIVGLDLTTEEKMEIFKTLKGFKVDTEKRTVAID